ncbi:alanine racemase [Pseudothermotoga hypogea DSM 11164 = NBRC 106472]|uniref:Alanine racemase n=1 Tax=Pseudothermotoga hypogea DSM 11164 = NBRC 106472 TaxID=1123384 RepID=A0A0X1KT41_9THEM|nr:MULTISPECIES: alanine/ornithine racemase family PLP-dependent enzyme [Pseudothermotoga]AJC74435.1 alanine racemase [Pseudothermotoga hypogea DSM 11164 = NBRC 106472]MBC7122214.1 alanine/ornithine racemase family PLP-dependent enzyme [Pseudothermotoga sp.]MDI6861954.1 alanine/ornithine racemase family PLP-dependent enzyme [Pseudothermotoga sp.]
MRPRLYVDLSKIRANAQRVLEFLSKHGIELVAVTKVTLGDPNIARVLREAGVRIIGESRIQNVERLISSGVTGPFMMLRIPQLSEIDSIVGLCDYILVSELDVVRKIEELCREKKHRTKLIYMVDVGDLREGVWYENAVEEVVQAAKMCDWAELCGVGTNLGCYGGVLASEENMRMLLNIRDNVERLTKKSFPIVSGGNTSALKLVEEERLPQGVNQFRVGEAIYLGTDVTNNREISWLERDAFILEAEVIELKTKPSVPVGETGFDAFGRKPNFFDKGWRRRAILALGEQDTVPGQLKPLDEKVEVIHASSDHTIVDISDVDRSIRVGDTMKFRLTYAALLRAMTCPHVEKIYV